MPAVRRWHAAAPTGSSASCRPPASTAATTTRRRRAAGAAHGPVASSATRRRCAARPARCSDLRTRVLCFAGFGLCWTSRLQSRRGWPQTEPRADSRQPLSAVFPPAAAGQRADDAEDRRRAVDQMSFGRRRRPPERSAARTGRRRRHVRAERGQGRMALLRVPLSAFGDAARRPRRTLQAAARPAGRVRLVDAEPLRRRLAAVGRADERLVAALCRRRRGCIAAGAGSRGRTHRGAGRARAAGRNAGDDLHFSAVALGGPAHGLPADTCSPCSAGRNADARVLLSADGGRRGSARTAGAGRRLGARHGVHVRGGRAAVVFLRQRGLGFSTLGTWQRRRHGRPPMAARVLRRLVRQRRPIFIGDRVFACSATRSSKGGSTAGAWRADHRAAGINFAPYVRQRMRAGIRSSELNAMRPW